MDVNTLTAYIVLIRTMERLLAVAFGGFAVYLGFQLFLKLPDQSNSEGKLILPGNVSIFLTRVGPGAIFAAFGLVVVALSIYRGMNIDTDVSPVGTTRRISGAAQTVQTQEGLPLLDDRDDVQRLIFVLNNTLPAVMRDDLSQEKEVDLNLALPEIKLRLMLTVWNDEEWGDRVLFAQWVPDSAFRDPPDEGAFKFFNSGKEGDQP